MIESPALTWPELGLLGLGWIFNVTFAATGHIAGADAAFLFTWVLLAGAFATRVAFLRQDLPPPGFVLAAMGILAGITAAVLLLTVRLVPSTLFQRHLAHLLLYEGFILGPILGVGGFLFPRFFQRAEGGAPSPRTWTSRATESFLVGLLLLGTYLAQAAGETRVMPIVRGILIIAYLGRHLPLSRFRQGTGTLSTMLQLSLLSLLLGLCLSGLSAVFTVAIKHLLFIGGFGLLILAIASRVTLGHAGRVDLAQGKRHSLRWIMGIVLLGAATRVVADFIPEIRVSHHLYASLAWILAAAVWSWAVLRYAWQPDPEDSSHSPS